MSEKIYCKDCRFYENEVCHRTPPVYVFNGVEAVLVYPDVDEDDWCGLAKLKEELEYKAIENKANESKREFEETFERLQKKHGGEPVTITDMAANLKISEWSVRNWIKLNSEITPLRFKNGIVFFKNEDSEDN